ncbi:MAG: hypothetical protein U0167_15660 [bacterium]
MNGSQGAVVLLEVRVDGADRDEAAALEALGRARLLLEAPDPGRTWSPAAAPGVTGSLSLKSASDAFSFLHRIRTELCADPAKPRVRIAAGVGLGDELEGTRLAREAFKSLGRRGRHFTRALTPDPQANIVLAALCRTLDSLHGGWTRAQWQAIQRRDGGRTLQEIGRELGIAYQNVSKRLIAARYSLYREVLDATSLVFTHSNSSV